MMNNNIMNMLVSRRGTGRILHFCYTGITKDKLILFKSQFAYQHRPCACSLRLVSLLPDTDQGRYKHV
jgi:hypothetical protein